MEELSVWNWMVILPSTNKYGQVVTFLDPCQFYKHFYSFIFKSLGPWLLKKKFLTISYYRRGKRLSSHFWGSA